LHYSPCCPSLYVFRHCLRGSTRDREGINNRIRSFAASAIGRALSDGKQLLEVEFPPLLETRGYFDDFSDIEELNANADFGMELGATKELAEFAPDGTLWLCYPDEGEAARALDLWTGMKYRQATVTCISRAVTELGGEPLIPSGKETQDLLKGFANKLMGNEPPPAPAPAPPPALHLVIQPGNSGPIEDWLNMEKLKVDGTPMICLNGALDKVTSGYYTNFLRPISALLSQCSARFFVKFESAYYLKSLGMNQGWLYRVYPEPWQLHRQTAEGFELVETYEEKPSLGACTDRIISG